jgi:UDP-N-acetylmuramyl pentapeptide phosphotransferase/UDP-N-acetylglucosamine-1-phosphate transferase
VLRDVEVQWFVAVPVIVIASALATAALSIALRPLLMRYALARPNARSSHRVPTPQGAGMAVISVTILAIVATRLFLPGLSRGPAIGLVLCATGALAVLGAADDIVTLRALPRLVCQLTAAAAVIVSLPVTLRIAQWCPLVVERVVLVLALVWFINLVNFMDGLDLITVAEVVPICAGIVVLSALGKAPPLAALIALVLGGAMLGFAPFNRPVAKLFLGDVGSLPIGLLLGWTLVLVAMSGAVAAAVLMPLYYLADATITLLRRLAKGERVWEAHRTHFYQRATDHGFSVTEIVVRIFVLGGALVALGVVSAMCSSVAISAVALTLGGLAVAGLLHIFSRQRA